MTMEMTDQMRELLDSALADGNPCLLGTATKAGDPQISPKGSVAVFDPKTLSYWERSKRSALAHLGENPRVVVFFRSPKHAAEMPQYAGGALRFHGTARIVEDGPVREQVWQRTIKAEQDRDPEKKGVGVLIDVEKIELLSGAVVMQKD
jgi:hypothetical protein